MSFVRSEESIAGSMVRFGSEDRKSTRLNSSHRCISYAAFCLKNQDEHSWWHFSLKAAPTRVTREPASPVYFMAAPQPVNAHDFWPGQCTGDDVWATAIGQSHR